VRDFDIYWKVNLSASILAIVLKDKSRFFEVMNKASYLLSIVVPIFNGKFAKVGKKI
jgi:hypothetical protein